MAWRIDDRVVFRRREKLFGRARNRHTALALFLLAIHVKRKRKRRFAQTFGFLLQFLHLTLRDATELENQATSRRRFASIDVATDNNGNMLCLQTFFFQVDSTVSVHEKREIPC